jgi:hypothetical protein
MIAAPCLIARTKAGKTKRVEALQPVPLPGQAVWNQRVRNWNEGLSA